MAEDYQQTDTAAPCGVIQACSAVAPAADADAREASVGGTAGATELACAVAAASSELCYADEIAIADDTSLDAGDATLRLNITTAQNDLTWEEVYVCRLNSSCTSQETLGSVTGLANDVSAGGVFTQTVSLSAASAHNEGDKVYVTYVFANAHAKTGRTVSITPDQLVTMPFTPAASGGPLAGAQYYRSRLAQQQMG